jgi:ABC-2 type transport system permease protein
VFASIVLFVIAINNLSFDKSLINILLLVLLLLFSAIIYASLYILCACVCFKTIEGLEFTNIFTDGSREFGQYPMDLFRKEVLIVFTYLIPIACVNYYPIMYILGQSNSILYLISPLFCLLLFIVAITTFNKCLEHYESAGS